MNEVVKCCSCGAGLDFEDGKSKVKCNYCGSTVRVVAEGTGKQQTMHTKLAFRARPWMAVVVISFGSIFFLFGVISLVKAVIVMSNFVEVEATIIEISEPIYDSSSENPTASYRYRCQYTFEGAEYQVWSKGAVSPKPIVGEKKMIYVNPRKPAESEEVSLVSSIAGVVIGGLIFSLGTVWFLKIKKVEKSRQEQIQKIKNNV